MSEGFVVRLRGLPWSATEAEIAEFLSVNIVGGEGGIKSILTNEGRPSGEAYVELFSQDDVDAALAKDHEKMGRRYIEVFSATTKEMEYVLSKSGRTGSDNAAGSDTIVRLRGLPWKAAKQDVMNFFQGLDIVPNGILLPLDSSGRASGEAYVEFSSPDDASQALGKHKEKIGQRYIEVFKSSRREVNEVANGGSGGGYGGNRKRPGPYDRPGGMGSGRRGGYGGGYNNSGGYDGGYNEGGYGDDYNNYDEGWGNDDGYYGGGGYDQGGYDDYNNYGGDNNYGGGYDNGDGYGSGGYGGGYDDYSGEESGKFVVHMRGLPFKATDQDIRMFFSPVVPVNIQREYGDDGRISGEANAEFASYDDAQAAMEKNKATMESRYIELFYRGEDDNGGRNGGGRRNGGGGGSGIKPLMGGMRSRGGHGGPMRRGRGRGGYGGRY